MKTVGWATLAAVLIFLLDRLFLRLEAAGHLYYRKRKPSPGAVGSALAQMHEIFEPQRQHVADVQRKPA